MADLRRQSSLLATLKRAVEYCKTLGTARPSKSTLDTRLKRLEVDYETFLKLQQLIEDTCADQGLLEKEFAIRGQAEEFYFFCSAALNEALRQYTAPAATSGQSSSNSAAAASGNQNGNQNNVILPRIEIPTFSGIYQEWPSFQDHFISLIHSKPNLTEVEKLHYLKSYITGEAADLIRSIQITNANYAVAWKLIKDRYNNKRFIVDSHLRSLVNLPLAKDGDPKTLKRLIDTVQEATRALAVMGLPVNQWDALVVHLTVARLDPESHKVWELQLTKNDLPTFRQLETFIENRWQSFEMLTPKKLENISRTQPKPSRETGRKSHSFVATKSSNDIGTAPSACPLCNSMHPIYMCNKFKEMPFDTKLATVRAKGLCFNCLKSNHVLGNCPNPTSCRHCGKRHHSSMHKPQGAPANGGNQSRANPICDNNQAPTTSTNIHFASGSSRILLSTAIVLIKSNAGHLVPVRALLDSGSQSTFITEVLATKLGLKRNPTNTFLSGIGQTPIRKATSTVDICIHSRINNEFVAMTRSITIDKITGLIPDETIRRNNWPHLSNLALADPQYYQATDIEMLLGADIYGDILVDGLLPKMNGSPFAQNTKLGWVLFGRVTETGALVNTNHIRNFHIETSEDPEPQDAILRKFWEIEEVDLTRKPSREEIWAEEHFLRTHFRDETGRYVVALPFNDNSTPLGESRAIAVRQLHRMEKRFRNDPALRVEYSSFMREYLDLRHMEKVPISDMNLKSESVFYLPHHAVRNESSTTTKLRVVFNGSMKTSTGISLNDKLLVGPTIQEDLFSIIVRWRSHRVVLNADVTKMYRQIRMQNEHANYQRIVWRFSESDPVTDYRLTTVTYGTASAAFLAIRAMQQLASDESENYPIESEIIRRDFYVDDLMTGSHDVASALRIQHNLNELAPKGGFQLRKWNSNRIELLQRSAGEHHEQPLIELMDKGIKVLGICWNPNEDCFQFKISMTPDLTHYTKRDILSSIAKQFDPFGWISPVIIVAKIILQRLWLTGLSWDDQVSGDIATTWENYKNQLSALGCIKIDRWVGIADIDTFELCGFCDASNDAYAAVVYSRSVSKCGEIKIQLISAKTKVAPIKQLCTPRLELNGAVLLARLISKIKFSFVHRIDAIYTFSDSTTVLAWIKGHPNQWQNFVANRLTEIHKYTEVTSWKFVRSGDNPADCASRGVLPNNLPSHPLWWHGPKWLGQPTESWPTHKHLQFKTNLEERKASRTFLVTAENPWLMAFKRYSSLDKLVRMVAYWIRFMKRLRGDTACGILSVNDLRASMEQIIRMVQRADFGFEIQCILAGDQLPSGSRIGSLSPFIDGDGILRVGGRLAKSCLLPQGKYPIILSRKGFVTKLLVQKVHLTTIHGGMALMMSTLRNKYWIPGMRDVIRRCIYQCHTCHRYRCQAQQQIMANLPSARVQPTRAFLHSGVDFAGPITIKLYRGRCKQTAKSYISLFVCMVTKAIHLELVSDLTSEAFLAAFRRFIARRGRCTDLYSDCGTNFVGANRELQLFASQLQEEKFVSMLINDGTTWHFNPPASPHFGGLWEAGVKSMKGHLRKIIGNSLFTFEELATVLCQIEACLNSRPLCPMSDTIDDLEVLTPGHFLVGEPTVMMPTPSLLELPENRLSRWQLIQQRVQSFWKAWAGEYLSRLQRRPKWTRESENLVDGQLVLIREENIPPSKWVIGRVIQTMPGDDGKVRVVLLKTPHGTIKRPIVKLSTLPMPTAPADHDII